MKKTQFGATILEGHDVADLPLVSQNAQILEDEIIKNRAELEDLKATGGSQEDINKLEESIKELESKMPDTLDDLYVSESWKVPGGQVVLALQREMGETKGATSSSEDLTDVTTEHDKQINASENSSVSGKNSQVNASGKSKALSDRSQVNASYGCQALGNNTQINASSSSSVNAVRASIISSSYSHIAQGANGSVIVASDGGTDNGSCEIKEWNSILLSSRSTNNPVRFTVAGGFGDAVDGQGTTQNRKWEINSITGEIKASGSLTGNSSFADFAEYMESENGERLPLGSMVTMGKGQTIKLAEEGDFPIGIISATAGIILNAQGFEWKDRYLYDRYGQPILVDAEVIDEHKIYKMYHEKERDISIEEFIDTLDEVPMTIEKRPMLNFDYDPKKEYIPRAERPEWNVVGMKGQIYVNIDDTVSEGDFIQSSKNGIATKGNAFNRNWLVMEVTTPYQEELGHGIARVII